MTPTSLDERPPAPPEPVAIGKPALLLTGAVWLLLAPALWLAVLDPRWGTRSWDDLTQATMAALILQTATLTLALGLPLLFGDLDLSVGAVAIGGAMLAVSQATDSMADFLVLLPLATLIGAGIGLVNGLLATTTRLPAAVVTLLTGLLLVAGLSQIDVHLAVPSQRRLTLLWPAVLLFASASLLLLAGIRGTRAPGSDPRAPADSAGSPDPPTQPDPLARIVALVACGSLAMVAGAMMGAQGIRDAGFFSSTAYSAVVPLAGLIVGGQHVLVGWLRPIAGVAGAALTAALCLASTQPSDNLAPAVLPAILLAALLAWLWRRTGRTGRSGAPV